MLALDNRVDQVLTWQLHKYKQKLVQNDNIWEIIKIHTAGLPISEAHTKNQFADKPEELRHFWDRRWKAVGEENSDLLCLFL